MSIRLQLLAIALTTLVLPWAGCQYARELESTLRISQENSLKAAADTIAHALSAEPSRVFSEADMGEPFDAASGDLYVYRLHHEPLLDGYREGLDLAAEPRALPAPSGLAARLLAGHTERYLYLYLEVDDPGFEAQPNDGLPGRGGFDRVDVTLQRPDGAEASYFFATGAPGPTFAQFVVRGDNGVGHAISEPRIQAFWLQTSHGYHLEARIPRTLVGSRLWIEAIDGEGGARAGVMGEDSLRGGRLFMATAGLGELLATFLGAGTRATVIDANGLIVGSAGSLPNGYAEDGRAPAGTWYRRFITEDTSHWPLQASGMDHLEGDSVTRALAGHPAAQWLRASPGQAPLLCAAAPIPVGERTGGAVVLEQSGDQLLELRDRALSRLFNRTLLGTGFAAAIAFALATWISLRIGRLRLAADGAVARDGRIRLEMPESDRADEIGSLSRAFERLLRRLNEHTEYLRTLGGKLSHELRTPLTIVRSSLDNLESEGARTDQQGYLARARDGVLRLSSILSALGAASRVEESIKQADRVSFDLKSLVESAVAGYRDGFPAARIELRAPQDPCVMQGAPDLIVQMLDKLIENAVDFCSATGRILVTLARSDAGYELCVDNDGPAIRPDVQSRLFESLFEHRAGTGDKPHLGLGLYIVRLIAELHGGRAVSANRPDGAGVCFSVTLPRVLPPRGDVCKTIVV